MINLKEYHYFDRKRPTKLWRNYEGSLEVSPLEDMDNMENLCATMKELGAIFYVDAKKSMEVMDCELLDEQDILHPRYGWAVSDLAERLRASSKRKESSSYMSCNPV